MHKDLDEFEFLPDPTTDQSDLLLSAQKSTYYLEATLAPSFLIRSSSFFQVSRTTIQSDQSSNLVRSDQGLQS